jgi:hypothetical protein
MKIINCLKFLLAAAVLSFVSCATVKPVSAEEKERLLRNNNLIAILNTKLSGTKIGYYWGIAGIIPYYIPDIDNNLKTLKISFQNLALQPVKETVFIVTPFNSSGEITSDTRDGKSTIEIKYTDAVLPDKVANIQLVSVWSNKSISYFVINAVKLSFVNGEDVYYENEQINDMILCEYGPKKKKKSK